MPPFAVTGLADCSSPPQSPTQYDRVDDSDGVSDTGSFIDDRLVPTVWRTFPSAAPDAKSDLAEHSNSHRPTLRAQSASLAIYAQTTATPESVRSLPDTAPTIVWHNPSPSHTSTTKPLKSPNLDHSRPASTSINQSHQDRSATMIYMPRQTTMPDPQANATRISETSSPQIVDRQAHSSCPIANHPRGYTNPPQAGRGWITPHPLSIAPSDRASPPQSHISWPASDGIRKMTYEDWCTLHAELDTGSHNDTRLRSPQSPAPSTAELMRRFRAHTYDDGTASGSTTPRVFGRTSTNSTTAMPSGRVHLQMPWDLATAQDADEPYW